MPRFTTPVILAAGAAGIAGAVFAYQSTAAGTASTSALTTPVSLESAEPTPIIRLLPCERGTKLIDGACVRTRTRIVVQDVPAAAPAPSSQVSSGRSRGGDDESRPRSPEVPRDDDSGYDDNDRDDRDDRDDDTHDSDASRDTRDTRDTDDYPDSDEFEDEREDD